MSTPGGWDPSNPGPFDPLMVKDTYQGLWHTGLNGTEVSYLFPEVREMYEQICLEWGVRIDTYVDSTSVLADIPVNPHLPNYIATNHGIVDMDLITERNFDADHPASSSLADIAEIKFYSVKPIFRNEATDSPGLAGRQIFRNFAS